MRNKLEKYLVNYKWRELPSLSGRTNHLPCGIIVPLQLDPQPICFSGRRSENLKTHAGEICFPGGRPEPEDVDVQATAIREAREEMNIQKIEVIGRLSSIPVYTTDYRLEPFVGIIDDTPLKADKNEITEIIPISIKEVLARPSINCIPWNNGERMHLSPVFEVGQHLMFGATAYVFLELLEIISSIMGIPLPKQICGPYKWSDLLPGVK